MNKSVDKLLREKKREEKLLAEVFKHKNTADMSDCGAKEKLDKVKMAAGLHKEIS